MGMPKTRGCPYHCKSRQLEPSNYRIGIGLPWKSRTSLEEKNAPDCPDLSPSIPDKDPALTNAFSLLSKIDSRPRYSFDAFTTVHTLGRKLNPMNMVKTYAPAILRFWCVFDLLNHFQERFQIDAFSNKNALVWSGPQSLSFLPSANSGTHENWKPPIVRRDLSFARKLHKSTQAQILQENSLIFVWNYQAFPASSWLD